MFILVVVVVVVVVMRMTATTMVGISSTGTHSWPMCGRGNGTPERYEYRYARYSFTSVLSPYGIPNSQQQQQQINVHVVCIMHIYMIYTKAIIINYHVVLSDRWYIIIGTFSSLVICAWVCVVCVCFSNVVRYNHNIQHENRVSYRINHACKYLTENRPLGVYLFHI